mmetsp:Transcript_114385/g.202754  ORF Transcript_114385/g.202754 Transcript_114385/m.202754 type:complete len:222 (-) Transcript_114385:708-1373(-)
MRPCTSIYECIEGHNRELEFQIQHLLIHRPNAVKLLLLSEALQDRAVDHCIDLMAAGFILRNVANELIASLNITIGGEGFDHATKNDAGGDDVACPHFAPCVPHPFDVPQRPICTNHASISVWAFHMQMLDSALLEVRLQEVWTARAQASLHYGTEQDLVHVPINFIQQGQDPLQMRRLRNCLDAFQEYGARDPVRLGTTALHLINQSPHLLGAFLHSNNQ